ncbi:MAG: UbiA family prenyltransferase [Thermodesulfobacteriota bacterium]|nr:UbiA family prenyltransferase [Thermodesulfobacteriota bacterium]
MRPYLLFISGIAGLAGMAMAESPSIVSVVIAGIPCFLGYGLGQALTDVFQTDTDAISSAYRPLVKGEISKTAVFVVSLTGLMLTLPVFALLNPLIVLPCTGAIVGLVLYTPLKRHWWSGPPWNSMIVALLPLMGFMAISPAPLFSADSLPLIYTLLAVFFAYANFVVGGYFKDIAADRKTGYHTVQVRFGWRAAAVYGDILSVLAFAFTALAVLPAIIGGGFTGIGALALLLVTGGINAISQIRLHAIRDEARSHGPITGIVRSFILYCSLIVFAHQPQWGPGLVAYYCLFETALFMRPEESQV